MWRSLEYLTTFLTINLKVRIDILNTVDVGINADDLEAWHRLPAKPGKNKPVIIRFVNRKNAKKVVSKQTKTKLKSMDPALVHLRKETKIFVAENMSPHFKHLSWMLRQLKIAKMIQGSWMQDVKLLVKPLGENSKLFSVSHSSDIFYRFFDFDFDFS